MLSGLSDRYVRVYFSGGHEKLVNELVSVQVTHATEKYVRGILVGK
jgi:hypothetical protein